MVIGTLNNDDAVVVSVVLVFDKPNAKPMVIEAIATVLAIKVVKKIIIIFLLFLFV